MRSGELEDARTGPATDHGFTESSRVGGGVGRVRLLAALLWIAVATGVVAPATRASTAPTLRFVSLQPLALRGEGFRPAERVVVTALTPIGPKRVTVRATVKGLGATFRLPNQPCGEAFAVRAVGGHGSRATLGVSGQPCVPRPID
jgi:hypothetical protein